MLLKHYLDRGVSKAELSRRFGVNRRTIHNWVDTGQLDRDLAAGARGYSPRPPVAHKLDPYEAIIDARLEAFPKLSAKRLFDEVRAAGYPGCYSRVNDYVRATRPREPVVSLVRFETPAGRQGQVDFATFTLPWGRRHALVIVLGYSRAAVAALLHSADHAGPDGRSGERLRPVRRGSGGAAVRPDARRGAVRRPRGRRRPGAERGVPAVRRALGVHAALVPTLSGPDQGQSGAPDPLHPRELLLRPLVCE